MRITSAFRSSVAWCGSPNSLFTFWNSTSARLRGKGQVQIFTFGDSAQYYSRLMERWARATSPQRRGESYCDARCVQTIITPGDRTRCAGMELSISLYWPLRLSRASQARNETLHTSSEWGVCVYVCLLVMQLVKHTSKTDTDSLGFIKRTIFTGLTQHLCDLGFFFKTEGCNWVWHISEVHYWRRSYSKFKVTKALA